MEIFNLTWQKFLKCISCRAKRWSHTTLL